MFDIFTLGDTQVFADVMNGVAMMFSNSPILKGNGAFQLGYGAFLGALILLTIIIYKAIWQGQFNWRTLILPIILYSLLTVPKTTVVIHDIYGVEAPKIIDNVPLGLAMPASVMSGITYYITEQFEKSFAVLPNDVTSTPLPKMTERGFLTPLQVMNSIRYDNINTDNPLLQKAMNQIYAKCIVANDAWSPDEYLKASNPYAYFQSVIEQTNTLVTFPVSQAGMANSITMPCDEAGGYLEKALEVHINGESADPTGLLSGNFNKHSFSEKLAKAMAVNNPYGKLQGTGGMTKYSATDVANMISGVSGMSQADGRQFIMNVLFHPMMQTSSKCLNDFGISEVGKCTAWVSTLEQWKDKSAASGTSFLKKMANGQNTMVLVGFMLFPFMVIMIMFLGLNSGKLVGGYTAFLLSNYLWLPIAAIVNFYSQYSLQEAIFIFRQTNPDGLITIQQAPELYTVLSSQLAVANNAMGMVPVLSAMLFGGMMWGVSALAKGINPVDNNGYDSSLNSKPITNSAPLNEHSSITNKDGIGPTTIVGLGTGNSKASQAVSVARSNAVAIDDQISEKLERLEKLTEKSTGGITQQFGVDEGTKSSSEQGREEATRYTRAKGVTDKTIEDGNKSSTGSIDDQDTLSILKEKNSSNAISGTGDVRGVVGESAKVQNREDDDPKKSKSPFKLGKLKSKLAAGITGSIDGTTANSGKVVLARKTINDDTDDTSFNRSNDSTTGINGGSFKDQNKVTIEDTISRIQRSNSATFKAQSYNEIIQKDTSNAYSVAEKREAARLESEVRSLSQQKAESIQYVMATSITDTDLSGRLNTLAPNSQLTHKAIDRTDELGSKLVDNWDQLKADAEKKLRLGGHAVPETIERVSVFIAAKHSNNAEVMYSGLDIISPVSTVEHFQNRETLEQLNSLPSNMNKQIKALEKSTNFDTKELEKAISNNRIGQENALEEINNGIKQTRNAVGLTEQKFDTLETVEVSKILLDDKAITKQIRGEHVTDSNAITAKGPVIADKDGNLILPQANNWTENPTKADKEIVEAGKQENWDQVTLLINQMQQLELGKSKVVDDEAKKFAEEIKKN
ncbi:hypothetical protein HLH17_02100 [Acinetobacter sp. ANC 5380]|uniref:TraG N-terminal Proteobacteria domain-containing protein n=1 Tax=Acinetobacter terrae TaxID=2731247 RepID=A0A7Y2RDB2_9GAMM|nr:conjugal transfer protein TraG N-terminal domain-containing protein [Acinetobacter terrae]NNH76494.1 hypothetical protein [Acinetobacter terrae]